MKFILILLTILTFRAFSAPDAIKCPTKKHSLYCRILEVKPSINRKFAFQLSNLLHKYMKRTHLNGKPNPYFGLDTNRAIAIAMQESSLRNVHRRTSILIPHLDCDRQGTFSERGLTCIQKYKFQSGYTDMTLFQFHVSTVRSYNMDIERLEKHDLEYIVEFYCRVMIDKLKMCKKLGADAWSCYHSKSSELRKIYKQLVDRYYPKEERL